MDVDNSAAENVRLLSELERDSSIVSQCQWRFLIGRGQLKTLFQTTGAQKPLKKPNHRGSEPVGTQLVGEGKQTQMLGLV